MFVILADSWLSHGFMRSRFKLTSIDQLKQLREQGIEEVLVDFSKSDREVQPTEDESATEEFEHNINHPQAVSDPKEGDAPAAWSSEQVVPEAFVSAIADNSMAPEQKSVVIYEHSLEMMDKLLESPTAENIKASKGAIHSLTDMILSDDATAQSLLRITSHDFYTYTHSVNVGVTGILLCKELFKNSDAHDLQELGAGFFLHDLGKIMVRPEVLNKPARLDDAEMRHIRIHPYQGYKILQQADALTEEVRTIVMQHHEFVDGSGYPKRLRDEEIHVYGRICGIADVYDALPADR